jgi:hypothetical protein
VGRHGTWGLYLLEIARREHMNNSTMR